MPVPVIDPTTSILSYPQWVPWEHTFSASNSPTSWNITSGGFPSGMSFQPAISIVSGSSSDNLIAATAHGLSDGAPIVFTSLSGGTGLSTGTLYFVRDSTPDVFSLATTAGGAVIDFTTDISGGNATRLGYLKGIATIPGVSTARLKASNGSGDSAELLITVGIEPAAMAMDTSSDLVWDWGTGNVIAQTSSVLSLTPASDGAPTIIVKEGDDLMARLRIVKDGTVIAPAASNLTLALKELDTEARTVVSDGYQQQGTDSGTSYLVHAPLTGSKLMSALSNYETDAGTAFDALADLRLEFDNSEAIGPSTLTKTSQTFRIRVIRPINA